VASARAVEHMVGHDVNPTVRPVGPSAQPLQEALDRRGALAADGWREPPDEAAVAQ